MFKALTAKLRNYLYPVSRTQEDTVQQFLNTPYRTNAGRPWEALYPVIEKQRSLHQWDWATNAPEKGVPNHLRMTSVVQTCKLCGATSMLSHRVPHLRYLNGWAPIGTLQPFCPATCQDTIELMKTSPMSLEEKRRYYDMWNNACRNVSDYSLKLA